MRAFINTVALCLAENTVPTQHLGHPYLVGDTSKKNLF
jgi:hypothetical protein